MSDVLKSPSTTDKMKSLLSKLPQLDTIPMELPNTRLDEADTLSTIHPADILFALHRAREAHKLAVSYRGFDVGAAALALAYGPTRFQLLTGVNIKPDEQSLLNVHAEQSTLRRTMYKGYEHISLLAVVGNTQHDQQSGHYMHTLHPCGLCRKALRGSRLIDPESTIIVSALPDLRTIEAYNLNQLDTYHDDPDSIELARLELSNEDEWSNTIGLFSVIWMRDHLSRLQTPSNRLF